MSRPRILAIRGGAIGDFILTLPALRLLRENFPAAHLEILGYRHIVALAEGRGYAEAARSIEYGSLAPFFARNAELPAEWVEYFSGFQQIVSWLFDPDAIFENNLRRAGVKSFLAAYAKIDDSAHAARQLARPLEGLALYLDDPAAAVWPSADDTANALAHLGENASAPSIALHPGSGSATKNWPLPRWLELCRALLARDDAARLLIVGGEADHAALDQLARELPANRTFFARDLALPTLAALLARCRLFLGHDSGISHLAAAVGAPCVLLFGPTDPAVWAPANPNVRVIVAPRCDLALLDLATVAEEVTALVAAAPSRDRR